LRERIEQSGEKWTDLVATLYSVHLLGPGLSTLILPLLCVTDYHAQIACSRQLPPTMFDPYCYI